MKSTPCASLCSSLALCALLSCPADAAAEADQSARLAGDPNARGAVLYYDQARALLAKKAFNDAAEKFNDCANQLEALRGHENLSLATLPTSAGPKNLEALRTECHDSAKSMTPSGPDPSRLRPTSYAMEPAATPDGPTKTTFACGEPVYVKLSRVNADATSADLHYQLDAAKQEKIAVSIYDASSEPRTGKNAIGVLPDPAAVDPADSEYAYFFYEKISALPAGKHDVALKLYPSSGQGTTEARFTIDCAAGMAPYKAAYDKLRAAHLKTVHWKRSRADLKKWEAAVLGHIDEPYGMGDVRAVKVAALDQQVRRYEATNDLASRQTAFAVGYSRPSDGRCFVVRGVLNEDYDLLRRRFLAPTSFTTPGQFSEIGCGELGVGGPAKARRPK